MEKEQISYFHNQGWRLAYRDKGVGIPILLIHGFASSSWVNWVATGWFSHLELAGFRVIAIDNRGHGFSDKSHEAQDYTPEAMADDACALLNHLGVTQAHVMGYSMGARISAFMALRHGAKMRSLILGGLGIGLVQGTGHWEPVAQALLAENIADIHDERGLMFRKFADRTGSDRQALAACVITSKKELTPDQVGSITLPALVAVGEHDELAGSPEPLAALLPQAQALTIPKRDHMLSVGDKIYNIDYESCKKFFICPSNRANCAAGSYLAAYPQ